MSFKTTILDKGLQWILESKISPIGWLNGHKSQVGNILTILSAVLLWLESNVCTSVVDLESTLGQVCEYVDQGQALIAFLLSLLVKLVGEWHKKDKIIRSK